MAKSLVRVPLQDGFDTVLTAPLDAASGAGAYFYVSTVPTFTFPTGMTTSVRLDTGKTTAEEIEIDQIDSVNLRLRIKTRNLPQGNGVTTTAQAHATGARCIISDSYGFWAAIATALNSLTGPFMVFANDAARDAYFTGVGGAEEGNACIDNGTLYVFESGAWRAKANGTDFASTRAVSAAAANVGEWYRDTGNSNALTYKATGGTSYAFVVDSTGKLTPTAYDFSADSTGAETTKPVNSAFITASKFFGYGSVAYFADGTDGDATITSGTTNLVRDMYYNNLTINSGGILNTAGYKVFCLGTCLIQAGGKIDRTGNAGGNGANITAGIAAVALTGGTLGNELGGAAGGAGSGSVAAGSNGVAGTAVNPSYSNVTGAVGGTGGAAGAAGGTGGAGGVSTRGALYNVLRTIGSVLAWLSFPAATISATPPTSIFPSSGQYGGTGSGGGGGGGSGFNGGSDNGGGGGGSGGCGGKIFVAARIFNNLGSIVAKGGAGGTGGTRTTAGGFGGGGAGGTGGVVILIYNTLTALGTIDVSGGAGGAAGGAGATAGGTGTTGSIIQLPVI